MNYNEYINQLNDEAIFKGIATMTEVPTMKVAQDTGKELVKLVNKTCNLSKQQIKEAKYAIAEITYKNTKYVTALYQINGASVFLRATDPVTQKYYIPNDIWIASTNAETEETELRHVMSLSTKEEV